MYVCAICVYVYVCFKYIHILLHVHKHKSTYSRQQRRSAKHYRTAARHPVALSFIHVYTYTYTHIGCKSLKGNMTKHKTTRLVRKKASVPQQCTQSESSRRHMHALPTVCSTYQHKDSSFTHTYTAQDVCLAAAQPASACVSRGFREQWHDPESWHQGLAMAHSCRQSP